MRCTSARKELFYRELGLASAIRAEELTAHLDRCAECAAWHARERALTGAIVGLRAEEPPFPVDVSARVAGGIRSTDPALADQWTARQAGWFSAAAIAFGTVLLAGLWKIAPDLPLLVDAARAMLSGAVQIATGLGAPLLAFAATLARSLAGTASSLQALSAPLRQAGPLVMGTIALSTAMMAGGILLVLGRDLTRQRWPRQNES